MPPHRYMLDVVVHPGVECLCSLSYVLLLAFIALDKVDYSSALTGHGKIVKWFHRKASLMYLALDEIAGVVEFPTSFLKQGLILFRCGKKTKWERKQDWIKKVHNLLGTMSAQLWVLLLDLGIDSGYIPTHPLY